MTNIHTYPHAATLNLYMTADTSAQTTYVLHSISNLILRTQLLFYCYIINTKLQFLLTHRHVGEHRVSCLAECSRVDVASAVREPSQEIGGVFQLVYPHHTQPLCLAGSHRKLGKKIGEGVDDDVAGLGFSIHVVVPDKRQEGGQSYVPPHYT